MSINKIDHIAKQHSLNAHYFIQQPIKTVNGDIHIKKYRKMKKVGEGSYSKCYLVQTLNSDSQYVVKIIPKNKLQTLIKQKLIYEIRIQKLLTHPRVVHLDHWFQDEDSQYIFMEYCSGGTLQSKLKQEGEYSQENIRHYGRQVVEALQYIHSKNVLHRDLKLCNFYIDQENNLKIGDFGFACQLAHPDQKKRQTCGTPNYIAPQSISGFGYSFSADVWGVGVMLFRMKFYECPFQGKNVASTLQNVKTCRYKFPKGVKISKQLKDLIQKIFVINYDDRITIEQIYHHPFFQKYEDVKNLKKQDKGFSLGKLFSLSKTKQAVQRPSKLENNNVNSLKPKRSNSCQTFKQIKQILKDKTTLKTASNPQNGLRTDPFSQQITLTSFNTTSRQNKTTRNITGDINSQLSVNRQQTTLNGSKSNKLQDFLKNQSASMSIKEQMKKTRSMYATKQQQKTLASTNKTTKHTLSNFLHKLNFPYEMQMERDIIVLHYKPYLKQIIYGTNSYLLYESKMNLFNMNGQQLIMEQQKLPRVLKYVIENNIKIEPTQQSKDEESQISIRFRIGLQGQLNKLPKSWIHAKQGITLKYNYNSQQLYVVKMLTQQNFYVEFQKVNLMYNNKYQLFEGVVIQRIYMNLLKNMLKK